MYIAANRRHMVQSRLNKIIKTPTLSDAQRMDLFERIKSSFRCGADMKAIKGAFRGLKEPLPNNGINVDKLSAHEAVLEHYRFLSGGLKPQHSDQCQLDVRSDFQAGTWSYTMHVGGAELVVCKDLPIDDGAVLMRFRDHSLVARAMGALSKAGHPDPKEIGERIRQDFQEMEGPKSGSFTDKNFEFLFQKLGAIARTVHADAQDAIRAEISMASGSTKYSPPHFGLKINDEWVSMVPLRTIGQMKSAIRESLSIGIDHANQAWGKNPSNVNEIAHALLGDSIKNENLSDVLNSSSGTMPDPKISALTGALEGQVLEISNQLFNNRNSVVLISMGLNRKSDIDHFIASQVAGLRNRAIGHTTYGQIGKALDWDHWFKVPQNPSVNPDDESKGSDPGIENLFTEHSSDDGEAVSLSPAVLLDYV